MPVYLVIDNDEEHSFEYVIDVLIKTLGVTSHVAALLTREIHSAKRASIEVPDVATATKLQQAMLAFGLDRRAKHSTAPLLVTIRESHDKLSCGSFANGKFILRPEFSDDKRRKPRIRFGSTGLFRRKVRGAMFLRIRRKRSLRGAGSASIWRRLSS